MELKRRTVIDMHQKRKLSSRLSIIIVVYI